MTPHGELLRLTQHPVDTYAWDVFMQDQAERPLLFHGTSAGFRESIERYGLPHRRRPYKVRQIHRVLSILRRNALIRPGSDAVLQTWTRSSVRERGYSLTFDWANALHFAVTNRCGETIEIFFRLLHEAWTSGRVAELPEPERGEVTAAYTWVSELVKGHNPLVVGVRFDPRWFSDARVSFFTDREVFKKLGRIPGLDRREMYVGSYDPNNVYMCRGEELPSIRDIPPSAIISLTEFRWNNELDALLDRVWHGHG
jgi:hypothetical protein